MFNNGDKVSLRYPHIIYKFFIPLPIRTGTFIKAINKKRCMVSSGLNTFETDISNLILVKKFIPEPFEKPKLKPKPKPIAKPVPVTPKLTKFAVGDKVIINGKQKRGIVDSINEKDGTYTVKITLSEYYALPHLVTRYDYPENEIFHQKPFYEVGDIVYDADGRQNGIIKKIDVVDGKTEYTLNPTMCYYSLNPTYVDAKSKKVRHILFDKFDKIKTNDNTNYSIKNEIIKLWK